VLTIPNVHLQAGADLVAYSGGKCLRGPQTAGLLLGRRDLVKAAWVHSAPHHGFARGHKVGKEEAVGMLMAVEMWVKRDHEAERRLWDGWLEAIAARVNELPSVTTTVREPKGLSNRTPSLIVRWDLARLPLSGDAVMQALLDGMPRVAVFAADAPGQGGVSVTPYMMAPGDDRVVATRLVGILAGSAPPPAPAPSAPATDLSGEWVVEIHYAASRSSHALYLRQRGRVLEGAHRGDFVTRPVSGSIEGSAVRFRSFFGEENGDALSFTFTGMLKGETLEGDLNMGEYLSAHWTARRASGRA
jgi:L-seryl-tRNA(Ser) seleniumtransferase